MNKVNFKQTITAGASAAGVATIVNGILFSIFHATGTLSDNIFVQPNTPLTIAPVVISSIVPTLIASLVFFLIEKYTNNGLRIFTIVSIVLGLLSLASPFIQIPGVTMGFAVVLDIMHVVVIAALLFFINKAVKAVK